MSTDERRSIRNRAVRGVLYFLLPYLAQLALPSTAGEWLRVKDLVTIAPEFALFLAYLAFGVAGAFAVAPAIDSAAQWGLRRLRAPLNRRSQQAELERLLPSIWNTSTLRRDLYSLLKGPRELDKHSGLQALQELGVIRTHYERSEKWNDPLLGHAGTYVYVFCELTRIAEPAVKRLAAELDRPAQSQATS